MYKRQPVAAEPIVAEGAQVASPVIQSADEEEEDMEFDMEWD